MVPLNDAVFAPLEERDKTMKRLISALTAGTLALSLLGTTAASAQSYRHGGWGHGGGWHDRGWHGRGDNTGALVGLGIGLFALGAIAASSHHDRYDDRYDYGPPPPPPPPAYGYYRDGYGYNY
jgi:hypothetical protein